MKAIALLGLLLCSPGLLANDAVLTALAAQLREARALPTGASTSYKCPPGLENVRGTAMAELLKVLPKPDFVAASSYSYALTSPVSSDQLGGGYPTITFYSTTSGLVEYVTCLYSQ